MRRKYYKDFYQGSDNSHWIKQERFNQVKLTTMDCLVILGIVSVLFGLLFVFTPWLM